MSEPGFRHILVPLDGTPTSELALGAAAQATMRSGQITLVRIVEDLVSDNYLPEGCDKKAFWQQQTQPAQEYLESLVSLVERPDLEVKTLVASGYPAEAILDIAAEFKVDAVAMCSHSRSKLRQVLLGSTVQTVMARCAVPVIIVHPTDTTPA